MWSFVVGRRAVLVGIGAAFVFSAPANAAFKISLDDGVNPVVTVADGGVGDLNAAAGAIGYFASIGVWTLIGTATTGPGGPGGFVQQLAGTSSSSGAGGLKVQVTNTDFTTGGLDPTPFRGTVSSSRQALGGGGSITGSLTADLFVDDPNAEFGTTANPISFSSSANSFGPVDGTAAVAGLTDPFSMTIRFLITHGAAGLTSAEASGRIAPIPGAIVLFLSALGGLVLTGRFGRRANAAA